MIVLWRTVAVGADEEECGALAEEMVVTGNGEGALHVWSLQAPYEPVALFEFASPRVHTLPWAPQ